MYLNYSSKSVISPFYVITIWGRDTDSLHTIWPGVCKEFEWSGTKQRQRRADSNSNINSNLWQIHRNEDQETSTSGTMTLMVQLSLWFLVPESGSSALPEFGFCAPMRSLGLGQVPRKHTMHQKLACTVANPTKRSGGGIALQSWPDLKQRGLSLPILYMDQSLGKASPEIGSAWDRQFPLAKGQFREQLSWEPSQPVLQPGREGRLQLGRGQLPDPPPWRLKSILCTT